jgi:hypothetical protein
MKAIPSEKARLSNSAHRWKIRGGTRGMSALLDGRASCSPCGIHSFHVRCTRGIPITINPWRNRFIVKKIAMAILLALMLAPAASFAQVMIRVGPPPPVYERRGPPPGEGYVWQDGYHRYDGGQYVWTPGHYERPPHPGARWVAHRWEHRHGGYVMVEGHWR